MHLFPPSGTGVSNLWNGLWNGLMEWNISRSAKQIEPVVLVRRHTLQGRAQPATSE